MRHVVPVALACILVLLLTGCGLQPLGGAASTSGEQANPVYPPLTFTTAPSEQPVDVLLDAQGQPYDTTTRGASFRWLSIGALTSPSGRIGITDGNLGCCADGYWQLAGHGRYEVRIAWATYANDSSTGSTPKPTEPPVTSTTAAGEPELQTQAAPQATDSLGVPVGTMVWVPGATVARWGPFRGGYLTDGGQGAFHTEELATSPEILDDRVWDWLDEGYFDYRLGDLDGAPGEDLVVFSNGMGDGTFPLIVGYDASEQVVALVTWSEAYPWRLAFPDGTPPQDVIDREKSISDCLAEHGRPADDGCAL